MPKKNAAKNLPSLRKKMADLKNKMKKETQAALKEAVKGFLSEFTNVEAIYWDQYTPYFNDGDTCEFSTCGMWLKFVKTEEEKAADREQEKEWAKKNKAPLEQYAGYLDSMEGAREDFDAKEYQYGEKKEKFSPIEAKAVKALRKLEKEITDDDAFYDMFGDHCTVRADRKGFTVTECQHD